MKISELIEKLEEIKEDYGDIEVEKELDDLKYTVESVKVDQWVDADNQPFFVATLLGWGE